MPNEAYGKFPNSIATRMARLGAHQVSTPPMVDVPSSELEGEIAYMKASIKGKADRAARQSAIYVVADSVKYLTTLFAEEAGELDCEISITVKAKPHIEKEG